MEERQNIATERRRVYSYESAGTRVERLFEDMVESLEKVPLEKRRELLFRWDRAAFYAQGLASRGIVEHRIALRPTPSVSSTPTKIKDKADISLFYRSGIFASATLTVSTVGATVFNLITADLGIPIALALFGIFLAFSVESLRFRKRLRIIA